MTRLYDLLDRLNDWTRDNWNAPYLWAGLVIAVVFGSLPLLVQAGLGVAVGLALVWADPTITIFGRTFGDDAEDPDA